MKGTDGKVKRCRTGKQGERERERERERVKVWSMGRDGSC